MITINLYRYTRDDDGVTVSPIRPKNKEYTVEYRLVADAGMILVKDGIRTSCIDTPDKDGWAEEPDNDQLLEEN